MVLQAVHFFNHFSFDIWKCSDAGHKAILYFFLPNTGHNPQQTLMPVSGRLESNLEGEGNFFYLPPETTWEKEITCWEAMEAQRAFGWRFVISLQLTLVFLGQQAQPWSLTCKTHMILNYEVIFLDYHAQLGKVYFCHKEICGGPQPHEGRKWNIVKALLQHSCFSHHILLVWESLQSQNIQGREESCKQESGIAGKKRGLVLWGQKTWRMELWLMVISCEGITGWG